MHGCQPPAKRGGVAATLTFSAKNQKKCSIKNKTQKYPMIQSIEDGRKQDGNRSIADKIIKRLHDLEKTVENNYGRWAWELLQNAKDSIADDIRKVDVVLARNGDEVSFSHNGNHFTEQDIRGLINQISSKEV